MLSTGCSAFNHLCLLVGLLLTCPPALAQDSLPALSSSRQVDAPLDAPRVTVVGSVKQSAVVLWQPGLRLLEVIACCGGPSLAPQDTKAVLLTHGGKTRAEVNLSALLDGNDQKQNLLLQPGDVLLVEPKDVGEVYVSGAILHPDPFAVSKNGISASDLLTETGGPTPEAALSHVQIIRGTQIKTCDLRSLRPGPAQSLRLFAGDLLLIPRLGSFAVRGAVQHPDVYPLPDGEALTVAHALALAGGPDADADIDGISIARHHYGRPLQNIRAGLTDQLSAGDTLIVPLDTHPHAGKVRPWLITRTALGVTP